MRMVFQHWSIFICRVETEVGQAGGRGTGRRRYLLHGVSGRAHDPRRLPPAQRVALQQVLFFQPFAQAEALHVHLLRRALPVVSRSGEHHLGGRPLQLVLRGSRRGKNCERRGRLIRFFPPWRAKVSLAKRVRVSRRARAGGKIIYFSNGKARGVVPEPRRGELEAAGRVALAHQRPRGAQDLYLFALHIYREPGPTLRAQRAQQRNLCLEELRQPELLALAPQQRRALRAAQVGADLHADHHVAKSLTFCKCAAVFIATIGKKVLRHDRGPGLREAQRDVVPRGVLALRAERPRAAQQPVQRRRLHGALQRDVDRFLLKGWRGGMCLRPSPFLAARRCCLLARLAPNNGLADAAVVAAGRDVGFAEHDRVQRDGLERYARQVLQQVCIRQVVRAANQKLLVRL
mmetsp:Transcript_20334/g.51345  ORF Transcript_20334/g.51345 Transcript_20334/m.51345 type:complete len:404 (+) Transcript_20334:625-1836(+)